MVNPERPVDGPVLHWREGGIAHIRFNRPNALNAIDLQMAVAFASACQQVGADPNVRAVILSAEGRAFMAGGDIRELHADPAQAARSLIAAMHDGIQRLTRMEAPVLCAVQGAVAGGGLGLMLACDLAIAAEGTQFSVAYPAIGASCDCSTSWGLAQVLGLRKAMQLTLLGETVNADQALTSGLVNWVVHADELQSHALEIAERLAQGPTVALGAMKKLLQSAVHNSLLEQLDAEAAHFIATTATADFGEGTSAFLEKRKPLFRGR